MNFAIIYNNYTVCASTIKPVHIVDYKWRSVELNFNIIRIYTQHDKGIGWISPKLESDPGKNRDYFYLTNIVAMCIKTRIYNRCIHIINIVYVSSAYAGSLNCLICHPSSLAQYIFHGFKVLFLIFWCIFCNKENRYPHIFPFCYIANMEIRYAK